MKIVYFAHSVLSCWNHGNAHFLRGVLSELAQRGHDVSACERRGAWSLTHLLADHGEAGLSAFHAAYPKLQPTMFGPKNETENDAENNAEIEGIVDGADLVIVHEWNTASLVALLGALRARGAGFRLLFHDTHHRAVSDPAAIRAFDLSFYDGILAFGETLARVYRAWGWGARAFVWHEAADLARFRPPETETARRGLVWIGNWGDDERSAEIERFLLRPAQACGLPLDIHGVRYPDAARAMLASHGAQYRGWLANADVPAVFGSHMATVHVPRRYYAELLPGIPTIRMFEALACGIPLVSAPWDDAEGLFEPGTDYLVGRDEAEMRRHLHEVAHDAALRRALAASGLARVRARHGCTHRADELLRIAALIGAEPEMAA